jgi:hypothetical protein
MDALYGAAVVFGFIHSFVHADDSASKVRVAVALVHAATSLDPRRNSEP